MTQMISHKLSQLPIKCLEKKIDDKLSNLRIIVIVLPLNNEKTFPIGSIKINTDTSDQTYPSKSNKYKLKSKL